MVSKLPECRILHHLPQSLLRALSVPQNPYNKATCEVGRVVNNGLHMYHFGLATPLPMKQDFQINLLIGSQDNCD